MPIEENTKAASRSVFIGSLFFMELVLCKAQTQALLN